MCSSSLSWLALEPACALISRSEPTAYSCRSAKSGRAGAVHHQAAECYAEAEKAGLFLQEGMWTRFFPVMFA